MEIPKMKIVIYALTFLGYAWSGYGAGMIGNLRDAILSAEQIFGDLLENVVIVARKFRSIHEVFDAAVEEHCVFECPNGGKAVRNKYHVATTDGCGSLGLQIPPDALPSSEMTKCCDGHDFCYDTCGSDKEKCDLEFKRCLYKICETAEQTIGQTVMKACKAAAKMLFTGTMALGCKSYMDCQTKACYCQPPKSRKFHTGGEL